jgi:hypothetical protein
MKSLTRIGTVMTDESKVTGVVMEECIAMELTIPPYDPFDGRLGR